MPGTPRRYRDDVLAVAARERAACPQGQLEVTTAYATNLYKLMAYKDEYEVARLHLLAGEAAALTEQFGEGARTRVLLHPPVLKRLGMRRKVSLGPAAVPVFRVLRAGRGLRGTPFDPFGRTAMRRAERALVPRYRDLVDRALRQLSPATGAQVVAVAELPDVVRGYEGVKWASLAEFDDRAARLLGALEQERPAEAPLPMAG